MRDSYTYVYCTVFTRESRYCYSAS